MVGGRFALLLNAVQLLLLVDYARNTPPLGPVWVLLFRRLQHSRPIGSERNVQHAWRWQQKSVQDGTCTTLAVARGVCKKHDAFGTCWFNHQQTNKPTHTRLAPRTARNTASGCSSISICCSQNTLLLCWSACERHFTVENFVLFKPNLERTNATHRYL